MRTKQRFIENQFQTKLNYQKFSLTKLTYL